jgi:hypothetical protein
MVTEPEHRAATRSRGAPVVQAGGCLELHRAHCASFSMYSANHPAAPVRLSALNAGGCTAGGNDPTLGARHRAVPPSVGSKLDLGDVTAVVDEVVERNRFLAPMP